SGRRPRSGHVPAARLVPQRDPAQPRRPVRVGRAPRHRRDQLVPDREAAQSPPVPGAARPRPGPRDRRRRGAGGGPGSRSAGRRGFLLLALAAGCWAFDRFFGYSSSWLRYMAAATSLRTQLVEYQTAWAKEMVAMAAREPDRTDAVRLIDFVRTFAWNVNDT